MSYFTFSCSIYVLGNCSRNWTVIVILSML